MSGVSVPPRLGIARNAPWWSSVKSLMATETGTATLRRPAGGPTTSRP